jgi:NAD(P)-dependent dehydrogenase (short-subunit alcohol dehydrogenase family)
MDIGLRDKVALVTGASREIGAAVVKTPASHSARVTISFEEEKRSEESISGTNSSYASGCTCFC